MQNEFDENSYIIGWEIDQKASKYFASSKILRFSL